MQQLLSWCLPGRLYGNLFKQPFIIVYRNIFDVSVVINQSHITVLSIQGSHTHNAAIKREVVYGG